MKPIVAAPTALVAGGLFLAGCTGGGSQPVTYPQEGGQTPPSVPTIVKTWGEFATADGITSTIGNIRNEAPTSYEGAPEQPGPDKRFVAVDFTVDVVGQHEAGPGFAEVRTDVGPATGVRNWQGSETTDLPITMLPGDKATGEYFFEVSKSAKELRLEIAPGGPTGYAEAYVHFRGPIPATQAPTPAKAPAGEAPTTPPPTDNCVLDPADMDYQTMVECGIADSKQDQPPQGPPPDQQPGYDPEGGVQFDENGYPIPGTGDYPGGYDPDTDPAPGPYDSPPNPDPAVPPGEGGMDQFEYGCQQGYIPAEKC